MNLRIKGVLEAARVCNFLYKGYGDLSGYSRTKNYINFLLLLLFLL